MARNAKDISPAAEGRLGKLSLKRKIAFSLLPVATLLLLAEGGLRLARFEYVEPPNFGLVMAFERQVWSAETIPDTDVLYRFRPADGHPEPDDRGFVPLHEFQINSRGYRGEEFTEKKSDPDAIRLLSYGDSVMFGVMLPIESTIPERLEKAMVDRGAPVESLIMALPSYTSTQNLWDWEARGLKYDADVLLLELASWNDFSAPQEPHTDREKREMLRAETTRRESWWHQHVRLVQAIDHWSDKRVRRAERQRPKLDPLKPWWEDAYANPELTRRVPLDEFKQNVQVFLSQAKERGLGVVIVVPALPSSTWTKLGHIVRPYHDYLRSIPTSDLVAVVDLQPAIDAAGGDVLFNDFCHYTASGTKAAADAIADSLEAVLHARRRVRRERRARGEE